MAVPAVSVMNTRRTKKIMFSFTHMVGVVIEKKNRSVQCFGAILKVAPANLANLEAGFSLGEIWRILPDIEHIYM